MFQLSRWKDACVKVVKPHESLILIITGLEIQVEVNMWVA